MKFSGGLGKVIGSAVAVADRVTNTGGLQCRIDHQPFVAETTDWLGGRPDTQPYKRRAIVEASARVFSLPDGKSGQSQHKLTFLASDFDLDVRDRLVIQPSGQTGTILSIDGLKNPAGGYLSPPVVHLGQVIGATR